MKEKIKNILYCIYEETFACPLVMDVSKDKWTHSVPFSVSVDNITISAKISRDEVLEILTKLCADIQIGCLVHHVEHKDEYVLTNRGIQYIERCIDEDERNHRQVKQNWITIGSIFLSAILGYGAAFGSVFLQNYLK